jgi:hypothetical protein
MAESSLGGAVDLDYAPSGLTWRSRGRLTLAASGIPSVERLLGQLPGIDGTRRHEARIERDQLVRAEFTQLSAEHNHVDSFDRAAEVEQLTCSREPVTISRKMLRGNVTELRPRPLRQHEDGSGDGLRRRGPSLQSPLSADAWTRVCDHRGAPPFQTYINGSCCYLPRMSISMSHHARTAIMEAPL